MREKTAQARAKLQKFLTQERLRQGNRAENAGFVTERRVNNQLLKIGNRMIRQIGLKAGRCRCPDSRQKVDLPIANAATDDDTLRRNCQD